MNEYHYQRRWGFLWGFMSGSCLIGGILLHPAFLAFAIIGALACYFLRNNYLRG